MRKQSAAAATVLLLVLSGCSDTTKPTTTTTTPVANDTPAHAISRMVTIYDQKSAAAYDGMFAGNFTFEFSNVTDPTLVQQYAAGWFKADEVASSTHLFSGYTPPGGTTLAAATSIDIELANMTPMGDTSPGVDSVTHQVLPTRVDGTITVAQSGSQPLAYPIEDNFEVFYFVRGDSAIGLDSTQPADAQHWYIYKWVDLSQPSLSPHSANSRAVLFPTWGALKARYR